METQQAGSVVIRYDDKIVRMFTLATVVWGLVGMLVGLLFAWVSVAMAAIGFVFLQGDPAEAAAGGALVLCVSVVCCLQIATGLSIVVARIRRHGTLDAEDAGLLEG